MTAPKPCEDGTVSIEAGLSKCAVCPSGAFCTHSGQGSNISSTFFGGIGVITHLKEINYGGCDPVDFYCPQGSTVLKTYEGIHFFLNCQYTQPNKIINIFPGWNRAPNQCFRGEFENRLKFKLKIIKKTSKSCLAACLLDKNCSGYHHSGLEDCFLLMMT